MIFSYDKQIKATKFDGMKFLKGNITVVGKCVGSRLYLVHCCVCEQDKELFKEGLFTCLFSDLRRGQIPCGCSVKTVWTEEQQRIRAHRLSEANNFKFKGWVGEFKFNKTYCVFECPVHGDWNTTTIGGAFKTKSGCPACFRDRVGKANIKPDLDMVEGFFNSGAFPMNTSFSRSPKLNKKGYPDYWYVECPICCTVNESLAHCLKSGKLPCACSNHSQQQGYINLIYDGDTPIAIKFGIARETIKRIEKQNKMSVYSVCNYAVWKFDSVRSCKDAEKEIKMSVERGILLKRDFKDGYSETTHLFNLERVSLIFEKYGGQIIKQHLGIYHGISP